MRSRLSWRIDRQTDTLELIPVKAAGSGIRTSMEDPGVKPVANTSATAEIKSGVTVTGINIAPAFDNGSIRSTNLSSKEESKHINNNLTTSLSNNDGEEYPEGGIRAWLVEVDANAALPILAEICLCHQSSTLVCLCCRQCMLTVVRDLLVVLDGHFVVGCRSS